MKAQSGEEVYEFDAEALAPPLIHSLASHCVICSHASLHSFDRSLAHSFASERMGNTFKHVD